MWMENLMTNLSQTSSTNPLHRTRLLKIHNMITPSQTGADVIPSTLAVKQAAALGRAGPVGSHGPLLQPPARSVTRIA